MSGIDAARARASGKLSLSLGFPPHRLGFSSCWPFRAVCPWASHYTSLSLSLLISSMELIPVLFPSISVGSGELVYEKHVSAHSTQLTVQQSFLSFSSGTKSGLCSVCVCVCVCVCKSSNPAHDLKSWRSTLKSSKHSPPHSPSCGSHLGRCVYAFSSAMKLIPPHLLCFSESFLSLKYPAHHLSLALI